VTTSATAYNNVTPVQMIASTPWDATSISIRCPAHVTSAGRSSAVFDIMIGGSGSEQVLIGPVPFGGFAATSILTLPIYIPAASRLSVRVRSSKLSTAHAFVYVLRGSPNAEATGFPHRWVAYGVSDDTTANAQGTIVAPGASNTWGSWTSLTASTTYAHDLWMPMADIGTASATANSELWRSQFAIASTTDAATMATNGTVMEGPWVQANSGESVGNYDGPTTGRWLGWGMSYGGIFYHPAPSGSPVSARAMNSAASPSSNAFGLSILAAVG
jgi:hypothetical protein